MRIKMKISEMVNNLHIDKKTNSKCDSQSRQMNKIDSWKFTWNDQKGFLDEFTVFYVPFQLIFDVSSYLNGENGD